MVLTEREAALDVSYPACPSQIATIRRAVVDVARAGGADESALLQVNLAVSEAATNAILHAYRDRPASDLGDVRVTVFLREGGWLDVRVRDRGIGLVPGSPRAGLGLGLGLMAHESERFEIRKVPGGGTDVLLRFRL